MKSCTSREAGSILATLDRFFRNNSTVPITYIRASFPRKVPLPTSVLYNSPGSLCCKTRLIENIEGKFAGVACCRGARCHEKSRARIKSFANLHSILSGRVAIMLIKLFTDWKIHRGRQTSLHSTEPCISPGARNHGNYLKPASLSRPVLPFSPVDLLRRVIRVQRTWNENSSACPQDFESRIRLWTNN